MRTLEFIRLTLIRAIVPALLFIGTTSATNASILSFTDVALFGAETTQQDNNGNLVTAALTSPVQQGEVSVDGSASADYLTGPRAFSSITTFNVPPSAPGVFVTAISEASSTDFLVLSGVPSSGLLGVALHLEGSVMITPGPKSADDFGFLVATLSNTALPGPPQFEFDTPNGFGLVSFALDTFLTLPYTDSSLALTLFAETQARCGITPCSVVTSIDSFKVTALSSPVLASSGRNYAVLAPEPATVSSMFIPLLVMAFLNIARRRKLEPC
jgi:hypothetical protein